jgi:anti-sigma-K factor RskA
LDIQEYISSGIIEAYVLGTLSNTKALEVEQMAAKHPEVKAEIGAIQEAMEKYASAHAIQPRLGLKEKVLNNLERTDYSELDTKIISLQKKNKVAEYIAAASISIAILSGGLAYFYYQKYSEMEQRAEATQMENSVLAGRSQSVHYNIQKQLEETQHQLSMMMDPSTSAVKLKGMKMAPQSSAMVYWNKKSNEIMLHVDALPKAPDQMEYQVWAMVGGKPMDIGMIDPNEDLMVMKNVEGAQAFAVTLEKKGGSAEPNMDSMCLMGKVNS